MSNDSLMSAFKVGDKVIVQYYIGSAAHPVCSPAVVTAIDESKERPIQVVLIKTQDLEHPLYFWTSAAKLRYETIFEIMGMT